MTIETHPESNASKSFGEWLLYALTLMFVFPLYLRLLYKDSVLSNTAKWLLTLLIVFSPSLWICVIVIALVFVLNAGDKEDNAKTARYAEVTQTCDTSELVFGDSVEAFKCQPYEDVILFTDKIGASDVDFLNSTFNSVKQDDTGSPDYTTSPINREQILYKQATYLGDTTFRGMYTYILKKGDVDVEPYILQSEKGIYEDEDWDSATANLTLPLSSEQWDRVLHLFKHTFESGDMEDFELGFKLNKDHLEITKHPSAVFDTKKYYRYFNFWDGDVDGYSAEESIYFSTGSVSKISITKGNLWMDSELGRFVLYDAIHKIWFVREIDSLMYVEH